MLIRGSAPSRMVREVSNRFDRREENRTPRSQMTVRPRNSGDDQRGTSPVPRFFMFVIEQTENKKKPAVGAGPVAYLWYVRKRGLFIVIARFLAGIFVVNRPIPAQSPVVAG